jgi:hypothetical protein
MPESFVVGDGVGIWNTRTGEVYAPEHARRVAGVICVSGGREQAQQSVNRRFLA